MFEKLKNPTRFPFPRHERTWRGIKLIAVLVMKNANVSFFPCNVDAKGETKFLLNIY